MTAFNKSVFNALKPGGVFVVEDYQTAPGAGFSQTGTLHRAEESAVKAEIEASGLKQERESKVLNNPKDDHSLRIFDPNIRGQADQYVLRFRKAG
jgi:predicted methyltransferase